MNKTRKVELVRVERSTAPALSPEIASFLEHKIAEALAKRDETLFEPFFRDAKTVRDIRRLQNVSETQKWRMYFRENGCLVCSERKRYLATGMCRTCRRRTYERLRAILRESESTAALPELPAVYPDEQKLAREILGPMLAGPEPAPSRVSYLLPGDLDAPKPDAHALLDRLVGQRVEAILGRPELRTFEPFFGPLAVLRALQQQLSVPELHKWSAYFDRWGCLRCGTRQKAHVACGICATCHGSTRYALNKIVRQLEARGDQHAMRTVR